MKTIDIQIYGLTLDIWINIDLITTNLKEYNLYIL